MMDSQQWNALLANISGITSEDLPKIFKQLPVLTEPQKRRVLGDAASALGKNYKDVLAEADNFLSNHTMQAAPINGKRIHTIQVLNFFTGNNAPTITPIPWLVPGFLARGGGTILFGQPGVSKTAHALALIANLHKGEFADFKFIALTTPRILYCDFDKGWRWTGPLVRAAFKGAGIGAISESFAYYSPLEEVCQMTGVSTNLETLGDLILEAAKKHNADLVVIDSLGQAMRGDGNSNQDAALALRVLNPVRALGCAVLVIDHATKSNIEQNSRAPTPSGGQQKRAWAVCTVALETEDATSNTVRWTVDKTNAKPFEPFVTQLKFVNTDGGELKSLTVSLVGEAGPRRTPETVSAQGEAEENILAALEQGDKTRAELGKDGTTGRALEALVKSRRVMKNAGRKGKYYLPSNYSIHPSQHLGFGLDGLNNSEVRDSDQHSSQIQANTKNLGLNVENPTKTPFYSDQDSGQAIEVEL